MSIHLHVEHLVLEGLPVDAAQGADVEAAVGAELERLLTEAPTAGVLRQGGARFSLTAPEITVSADEPADALGRRIGQAVHGAIIR